METKAERSSSGEKDGAEIWTKVIQVQYWTFAALLEPDTIRGCGSGQWQESSRNSTRITKGIFLMEGLLTARWEKWNELQGKWRCCTLHLQGWGSVSSHWLEEGHQPREHPYL